MELKSQEKIALLGVGSGLGESLLDLLSQKELLLKAWSRHQPKRSVDFITADFTRQEQWENIVNSLLDFEPARLIYISGGGPYGRFEEKSWASHEWAFKLNFLFPAYLMHKLLQSQSKPQQMIFVGSAIAENAPDLMAASYGASKHGLKGLILNLANENKGLDIRLFSPGYMKTKMLPSKNRPTSGREKVYEKVYEQARESSQVAIEIIDWMQHPSSPDQAHRISR